MGSDKRNKSDDRGRGGSTDPRRRRMGLPWAEELETRRLLANGASAWHASNANLYDPQNGPIANLGATLINVYKEYSTYVGAGSKGAFTPTQAKLLFFNGTSVMVDVLGNGNLAVAQQQATALGMKINATWGVSNRFSGYIPIGQLPQLAQLASVTSAAAVYRPVKYAYPFQGIGNNESANTLNVPLAVQAGVPNGTGQKIGVISDSVNQYQGGLADSVRTGDLPSNVQVIQDDPDLNGTDEGRAMLEQIYDIAPGAQLAFATGFGSDEQFATNILALAAAGCTVIVDDLGVATDGYYQDSAISQAINIVTSQGVTYLSSAGNSADYGYQSQFRGVNATVGSLGAGRYQNFNAVGGVQTQLPVNIPDYDPSNGNGPVLTLQFDQPLGAATSDVTFYLLDASGNIAAQGNSNPAATQDPFQFISAQPTPGNYNLVIKVNSGADPGHVAVISFNENANVLFDQSLGTAGGTFYPNTAGHNSGLNTISVGAVPFYNAQPYVSTAPHNEPFSSFGPRLIVFNPDGSPIAGGSQVLAKPDVSSPDSNNTSFFIPGTSLDTTRPPFNGAFPEYPGVPARTIGNTPTATNVGQTLPYFTGTSSAAPNLAAVVALMKQANATVTNAQIRSALIASAAPLNGAAQGVFNNQGGFGLVNATTAIAAVSVLQVNSVTPGNNATIAQAPGGITVNFSRPIALSTLTSQSIQVFAPPGLANVLVGQPVGLDSTTAPTSVFFPIVIVPAPGRIANGVYGVLVPAGITAADGSKLATSFTSFFNLQQTTAPQVTATGFIGRVITISFSELLNPATATSGNIFLIRANGVGNPLGGSSIPITPALGAVTTYNAINNTVTIDLTRVAQANLPTDHYGLIVTTGVTDAVGNPLNGAFSGVFPSGTNPSTGANFFQDLGVIGVQAPVISSFVLSPTTDTGLQGDSATGINRPSFVGQVNAVFPATNAGLTVYVQFNGINHAGLALGALNLGPGANGRGVFGQFDAVAITDAFGRFTINYPAGVAPLPEGQNLIRAVVVGATDAGAAGLAGVANTTFQIDTTRPYVGTLDGTSPTSVAENALINSLTTLTISVVDPVNPTSRTSPFAVSTQSKTPALDASGANNLANYKLFLYQLNAAGVVTATDESAFIKSATFFPTSNRVLSSDPYTGQILLTFASGLPMGRYGLFVIGTNEVAGFSGVSDAVGNGLTNSAASSASGQGVPFLLDFNLQPTPTYITGYNAYSVDSLGNAYGQTSGPRASYEVPVAGRTPGAPAPPTAFTIDFSNQLAAANFANDIQLVRSANTVNGITSIPDGDFGTLGQLNVNGTPLAQTGYTILPSSSYTVTLVNQYGGAASPGLPGYQNRLLITLNPGVSFAPDYYRVYLPNRGTTSILDAFGNQLDGEFLGYQNANGKYVDQLNDGSVRGGGAFDTPDLTGDGTAGGAFMTGFVVVPNGNVIYARADNIYNPQLPGNFPDGSIANPYPVLAPQATYNSLNGGDLNSSINAGVNFNPTYDRAGLGVFEPSAFFAAQEKVRLTQAPAVIVAVPSLFTRDPFSGAITQRPFVLQAPSGYNASDLQSNPQAYDASAAVPAMTTLILAAGSTLKMQNAALLVQNQGSALQVLGGPNSYQTVTVTSYKDSSVGGVTNGDPTSIPAPGDYGGILLRNFNQAGTTSAGRTTLFPGQIPITGSIESDDRLKGPFTNPNSRTSQLDAISGADSIMSSINYLVERYAGGVVPQQIGVAYDGIELQNSRPAITNTTISFASASSSNPSGANVAGLSVDVDSLLRDDVASGPLLRGDVFFNNGLNGIYVRAQQASGVSEPTTATNLAGGGRSYIFNNPYPYIFASQLRVGDRLIVETGGGSTTTTDRVYVSPGMILKFARGANINVASTASINVGDETYIREFDQNRANPALAGFRANSAALSNAIFTSEYDDAATSTFTDPTTGTVRTVVAPLPAVLGGAGPLQPTPASVPDAARWGGIFIASGAIGVLNSTTFRYGGGSINIPRGTSQEHVVEIGGSANDGAHVSITNSTFVGNADVPINLLPNSLLAGDATQPLVSGNPFIHGNVFLQNGLNGVGVQGGVLNEGLAFGDENLDHDSIWTGTDFTYILRDTIVLGPFGQSGVLNAPPATGFVAEPKPSVTLTLQSTLPNTLLADGTFVQAPGLPLIIKLKSNPGTEPPAEAAGVTPGANVAASSQGGAGFIAGVDNGVDPTGDSLLDNGVDSQIRILGIAGNSSTGQARVPVIITSLYDDTVGTTVNGVTLNQAVPGSTQQPLPGDGGVIYFGGNSLTTYNFQDPRSGSIIDNADIRYMTRIEQQGGGIIYALGTAGQTTAGVAFVDPNDVKFGLPIGTSTATQYNSPKKLTISNSNLASFSDGGVFSHPGFNQFEATTTINPITGRPSTTVARVTSITLNGEPTQLYMVNNTISNMLGGRGTGVEIISQTGDNTAFPSPSVNVIQNTTFVNNNVAVNVVAPTYDGRNSLSHAAVLVFDSIIAYTQSTTSFAFQGTGQIYGSDSQYNLFFNNRGPARADGASVGGGQNVNVAGGIQDSQSIIGDPLFRNVVIDPTNPALADPRTFNFNLLPGSAAIDRARSQLGPSIFGDLLWPAATIDRNNLNQIPVRNAVGDSNTIGGLNVNGFFNNPAIVTLPGTPVASRLFPDQWTATVNAFGPGAIVPANTANAVTPGTVGNPFYYNGTYAYTPLLGVRDILGNIRQKVTSANTGFGSDIGYDLGAFEYEIQNPPKVTSVTAVATTTGATSNLYVPNSIAGINQYPGQLRVGINERLNAGTITSSSVQLVGSGGDGIFGNTNDISYNLTGRLTFDTATNSIVVNTAGLIPLASLNDEYQLTLKGTGAAILRDTNGNALDGYTANNTLPLPSGTDDFPGTDFSVRFTVDTNPPTLVAGSFGLATGSYRFATNTGGSSAVFPLVNSRTPTFVGRVSDIFPPASPLAGDRVFIDISTTGDPNNFDLLNAGTGTTDASGNFSVTLTTPLPNSNFNVGPDGIEGTTDDTGVSLARVRIVDQAGNVSILPNAPLSQYFAAGAASFLEVDTTAPVVYSLSPSTGSLPTPNSDGTTTITAVFTKNIDPATITGNSVQVYRSGGSGTFTGTGTFVPIVNGSVTLTYLHTPSGALQVQFKIPAGQPNDLYRIVLKGTGTAPLRDVAGNALDGLGTGVAGSGDYTGGSFTLFTATNSRLLYVSNSAANSTSTGTSTVQGSRENPFPTIAAGLAAANVGDYVLVLPGTYRENITLKGQVRLESADPSSTDTSFTPGNALSTIIYGNTSTTSPLFNTRTGIATVFAANLPTIAGLDTEIAGFTILNPLIGDNVRGALDPTSAGITLYNSNVLVDKNYVINAGVGINILTTGANAVASRIYSNVIAGNVAGVGINDTGSTTSYASPAQVFNNTIADNTYGVIELATQANVTAGYLFNDIFYNNHDLSGLRNGTGIFSTAANSLVVGSNLFYGNGVSGAPSSNATGLFTGFNPAFLKATPDAAGNILGDPAFVSPRDPRPDGDTAPVFFNYANYDLSSRSPAINAALNAIAPGLDILYRRAVPIAGKGFPGTGPASMGAFYFMGTGGASTVVVTGQTPTGDPVGGASGPIRARALKSNFSLPIGTQKLTVVGTSLDPDGIQSGVGGVPAATIAAPTEIDVVFSDNIDPTSISAGDLVLSGSGLNASNPAHATSLSWVDDHTVRFLLTGGFNPTGTVNVSIPAGAIKDTDGVAIDAYAESFKLGPDAATAAAVAADAVSIPVQPVAVPGPVAVHYGKSAKGHHAKAHAAATAAAHKKELAAKAKAAAHAKAHAKAEAKAQAHAKAQAKAHAKVQAKAQHKHGEHGK